MSDQYPGQGGENRPEDQPTPGGDAPQQQPGQQPEQKLYGYEATPEAIRDDQPAQQQEPQSSLPPPPPVPPQQEGSRGFAPQPSQQPQQPKGPNPPPSAQPGPPPPPQQQQSPWAGGGQRPPAGPPPYQQPTQPPPFRGPAPGGPQPPYGYQQPYGAQPPRGPYPPPGGQYQQPYAPGGYPTPPRPRSRIAPVIIGITVLFFVVIFGAFTFLSSSIGGGTTTGGGGFGFLGEKIAILEVNGMIAEGSGYPADTAALVKQIKAWQDNDSIRGMVVRVNSPGGAVSATQDVYAALNEFRAPDANGKKRPIVISMGDVAASGGYYMAMAGDKVYANEGSLTGSVGVIMSFYDYQGLQEKIGVSSRNVKSGKFKDMGSGSRAMTTEEKELLGEMITDVYEQFFDAVVTGRASRVRELLNETDPTAVTEDEVRSHLSQYCDGRVFSGRQAYEYGMIDEMGTLDEAIEEAATMAGITNPDTVSTVKGPIKPSPGLFGMTGLVNKLENLPEQLGHAAGVKLEYRFAGW